MDEILYEFLYNIPIVFLLVVIFLSLNFLSKGADLLVDEAVKISVSLGISKMLIGATIVSLGTTIPEMTVSTAGALKGNADLALGNAVGSIITNTALIVGIISVLGSVFVDKSLMKKQGSIQLISVFLLVFMSIGDYKISSVEGILLLLLLIIYTGLNIFWSKKREPDYDDSYEKIEDPIFYIILKMFLGLILIILSSKILLPSVEIAALKVGIPQTVIAATLIAFGTSLPELVTAVTAVKKGYGELAIGNIIGANILNVLFVVGISSVVSKSGLFVDKLFFKLQYPVMLVAVSYFYYFGIKKKNEITKLEGLMLLLLYSVYLLLNYALK